MTAWIGDDGHLLRGKHRGEDASTVVRDDPNYVRWIVDEAESVADGDREILRRLLEQGGHRR